MRVLQKDSWLLFLLRGRMFSSNVKVRWVEARNIRLNLEKVRMYTQGGKGITRFNAGAEPSRVMFDFMTSKRGTTLTITITPSYESLPLAMSSDVFCLVD